MSNVEIVVKNREVSQEKPKDTLAEGFIPGVVYGHGSENILVKIDKKDFMRILSEAGESSLLVLKVEDKEIGNVVIKDYQLDPVTEEIVHFDLHKVRMDEEIITNVEIVFSGESPAVKDFGGTLVTVHDSVEIKCLPKDLIHEITLDLSVLKTVDDLVRVKDLNISDKVEILTDLEDVIVSVTPPRTESEMESLEEKPEENIDNVEGAVKEEKTEEGASTDK